MAEKKYLGSEGLISLVANVLVKLQGYVPTSRKVNNKTLTEDITLTYSDVGADQSGSAASALTSAKDYADEKIEAVTSGNITVAEATHAASADSATTATSSTKATQDGSDNVIVDTYETKTDSAAKLDEAKSYADTAATTVKNDLLNGAGEAYDTLKELGDLINENVTAIDALETIATGKADAQHTHAIADVTNLQSEIDAINAEIDTKVTSPATATVGQTIVAKTVDENGAPTEWEAVDLGNLLVDEDGDGWFGTTEEVAEIPNTLPDYTASDNGKVLSVVDGNAAWDTVDIADINGLQDTLNAKASMFGYTASSSDGIAYTATVEGITTLTSGISFVMIPSVNSASTTPTLNVNGLGAKGLRMRGSAGTGTAMSASIAAWLTSERAVQVTYNGLMWLAEVTRPAASDLSGTVAIANGGTNATTVEAARTNLEVYSKTEVDDLLSSAGGGVQIITWESTD